MAAILAVMAYGYWRACGHIRGWWIWPAWLVLAVLPVVPVLATPHAGYSSGVGFAVAMVLGPAVAAGRRRRKRRGGEEEKRRRESIRLAATRSRSVVATRSGAPGRERALRFASRPSGERNSRTPRVGAAGWRSGSSSPPAPTFRSTADCGARSSRRRLHHRPDDGRPRPGRRERHLLPQPAAGQHLRQALPGGGMGRPSPPPGSTCSRNPPTNVLRMSLPCRLEQLDDHAFALSLAPGDASYFSGLLGRFLIDGMREVGQVSSRAGVSGRRSGTTV